MLGTNQSSVRKEMVSTKNTKLVGEPENFLKVALEQKVKYLGTDKKQWILQWLKCITNKLSQI